MKVTIKDNSGAVLSAFADAIEHALDDVGEFCEGEAAKLIEQQDAIDTGRLHDSIEHTVDGTTVNIGTNVEYAVYVECGTGAANYPGGTTKPSWVYMDAQGRAHRAYPMKARPYLKPSVEEHKDEIIQYIKDRLEG